ncbi:MAG: YqaJ viral recombinase family protein, partial [Atopobiaceae bacterium]|nr:YqaJ viral recombinase family protein [Atopobiaceae bacterium]
MMRLDGYALPDWTEPECFDAYKMESDDEWLGFRTKGVGGSDVAAIMGISAYRSPVEVWMEKTGRKQPADLSDKEAVEWGNRLESIIRNKFAEMHPEFIVSESGVTFVSRKRPWAHANLDGMVRDANGDW